MRSEKQKLRPGCGSMLQHFFIDCAKIQALLRAYCIPLCNTLGHASVRSYSVSFETPPVRLGLKFWILR